MPDEERHYDVSVVAGEEISGTGCIALHRNGELEPAETAVPVAAGGAGVVYRAQSREGMEVAIKVLAPTRELVEAVETEVFRETFEREISILALVTHTRVAKILFSGVTELHGAEIPYYAMEFIEGQRLDDFIKQDVVGGLTFLELFDQVLDGLEHLHARRIMHADMKGANVLVREQYGHLDAKILDLGVAKALSLPERGSPDPDAQEEDDSPDYTYFYSSKKITRDEWKPRLGKRITRAELHEMFPSHDLYGLGMLIDAALGHAGLRARLDADLGLASRRALEQIRDRLLAPAGEEHYTSVSELRADWEKLHPRYLSPLGVAELGDAALAATSIATPTGRVSVTDRILDVINHPLMQRLRNIPQLELAQLLYPGATHTRLLHSIATFDMTRRFILHLLSDPGFRLLAEPEEVEATLLTALCHDVGHYPLSHMFEDWSYQEAQSGEGRELPSDDDLFPVLVDAPRAASSPFSELAETIEARLPTGVAPLHEYLFESARFSPAVRDAVQDLLQPTTASAQLLRALLDSPIDADKVTYLSDDSLMTGVRYGSGMDLDALFASIRPPRQGDFPAPPTPVVAIDDKGLPAAEQIMLARYWMLRRVYWHHTNRAIMAMVKFAIASLRSAGLLDVRDYIGATLFGGPRDGLTYLSQHLAAARKHGHLDDELIDPLQGLEAGGRGLYKRLVTVARGDAGVSGEVFERLAGRGGEGVLAAGEAARSAVGETIAEVVRPGEVLLDVPLKERARTATQVFVYLRSDPDQGIPLERASPVVGQLLAEFDTHVRKARLFVSPRVMDRIEASGPGAVRDAAFEALRTC